jgi:hypothetical protein
MYRVCMYEMEEASVGKSEVSTSISSYQSCMTFACTYYVYLCHVQSTSLTGLGLTAI